jgi:hypothetical protein
MYRLRRANSFSEPLTSECQTVECMNSTESDCKTHGFFWAGCISKDHSTCQFEKVPSLHAVKDNLESVKLTLMSIKGELYCIDLDSRFLNQESDLPILENMLEKLIIELEKIILNKNYCSLTKINRKIASLRMTMYESVVFKIVWEEFINKRRLGKVTSEDSTILLNKIEQENKFIRMTHNMQQAIERWRDDINKSISESTAISNLRSKFKKLESKYQTMLLNAEKEISKLKNYRKMDQETIKLQKMELNEQNELLEETTEMLNNTTKQFLDYKKSTKGKICKWEKQDCCQNPWNSKTNKIVVELIRELEQNKTEIMIKQEELNTKRQELTTYKRSVEDLEVQVVRFRHELTQKELKIQELLDTSHKLEQEIIFFKAENDYISKSSVESKGLLDHLQLKLSYSETNLESSRSILSQREKELFCIRKIQEDVKRELQFYVSESNWLKSRLQQAQRTIIDKDNMISVLENNLRLSKSYLNNRKFFWMIEKTTYIHFFCR